MRLDRWAMPDVFLLAGMVGYFRLAHLSQARVTIAAGGICLMAAAFFTMLSRAALDQRSVWRAILPDRSAPPGPIVMDGSWALLDHGNPVLRRSIALKRQGAIDKAMAQLLGELADDMISSIAAYAAKG